MRRLQIFRVQGIVTVSGDFVCYNRQCQRHFSEHRFRRRGVHRTVMSVAELCNRCPTYKYQYFGRAYYHNTACELPPTHGPPKHRHVRCVSKTPTEPDARNMRDLSRCGHGSDFCENENANLNYKGRSKCLCLSARSVSCAARAGTCCI